MGGADQAITLLGSWGEHAASWTRSETIPIFRYEDLLNDPTIWFNALTNQVLGEMSTPDHISHAIARSSFERLRAQESQFGYLHNWGGGPFFRAGKTEQWRTALSKSQVRRFVDCNGEQMERFGYLPTKF
jgi:hypothetical protein